MPTCDDAQLSLEMSRRGVPPPVSRELVDAHVATCATCAAYAATVEETATMTTTDWTTHDRVDADALYRRALAGLPTTSHLWKVAGLAVAIVTALLVFTYVGRPELLGARLIAMLVVGCVVVPIAAVAYRRSQLRAWQALADRPAEVIAQWRRQLVQQARAGLVMAPLLVVIAMTKLFPFERLTTSRAIVVASNLLLAGIMLHTWRVARRQLRELG